MLNQNRGQVWVETVLYTGIALTLIALVLAYISPKIELAQERAIVDQSISSLNKIDSKISEVLQAKGNRRILELEIKKGELYVSPEENEIYFLLKELSNPYSQEGVQIERGRMNILTVKNNSDYEVKISIPYTDIDLTYNELQVEKKFTPSAIPYSFSVEYL